MHVEKTLYNGGPSPGEEIAWFLSESVKVTAGVWNVDELTTVGEVEARCHALLQNY